MREEWDMSDSGLKKARELTSSGFHHDNLLKMAKHCREETHPDKLLTAYILNRVFSEMAEQLGDDPLFMSELRKLEAKYRTAVNLALESAVAGTSPEEQKRRLTDLIRLCWSL